MAKRNKYVEYARKHHKPSKKATVQGLYEQLALLVEHVAESRHIETMEAFRICNRMMTELTVQDIIERLNNDQRVL